jgi:dATP pyrophosphohydrolase
MSPVRPDLVDVWPFRLTDGALEILLLHRAAGDDVLPGLWQGVSGLIEEGESIADAALRELREETGFDEAMLEVFYHLDYAAQFLWEPADALMTSAYFAVRVQPGIDPRLSEEHDDFRWLPINDAIAIAVWPGYREGLTRIRDVLLEPAREPWFRLDPDRRRLARPPR